MRKVTVTSITLLALAATGCGTQVGSEVAFGCQVDSEEPVTDPSATPEGFAVSVDDALALFDGGYVGTFTPVGGDDLALTLDIALTGDAVVERRSVQTGGMEPAAEPSCTDRIRIPATVTFSAPPLLDEQVATHVTVDTDGAGAFFLDVLLEDLEGTATPTGFDPAAMAVTRLYVDGGTTDGAWQGDAWFVGETEPAGSGPDASVSSAPDDLGSWAASTDE